MGLTGFQTAFRTQTVTHRSTFVGHGKPFRTWESASAVAARLAPLGTYSPDHVWTCAESSGNMLNTAGSGTLTATSTSAAQYATATPFAGKRSLAFYDATGGYFVDSGTTVGDPGTGSVAFIGIARLGVVGATRTWASRLSGTNVGWFVQRYAGGIYLYVDDGAGGGAGVNHFFTGSPLPENNWCAFGFGYDTAANFCWVATAANGYSAVSRSDTSALSYASGTGALTLGAASNRYEHDLAWCAVFTGANALMYGNETAILKQLYTY